MCDSQFHSRVVRPIQPHSVSWAIRTSTKSKAQLADQA